MKIVFHGGNAANFRDDFEAFLTGSHDISVLPDVLETPEDIAAFKAAEVIVGVKLTDKDPHPAALRLYHAPAAGTDMIDIACLPRGALLCNAFGHEQAIAEYVMAALLARHVPLARADKRLRSGHWDYWAGRPGALRTELGDLSIGLLGYGHIGKAIAARAKAFGMGISVANRTKVPVGGIVDASFGLDELTSFMGSADVIVVSLPLNEATRGIVDAAALAAMRPDAVIVNVGRGPVIDEQALYGALAQKRIGGAIIDTWYQYPAPGTPETLPSSLPFHTLDALVMTPHMSGWTRGTVRRRQQTVADNIARLAAGQPLENIVATAGASVSIQAEPISASAFAPFGTLVSHEPGAALSDASAAFSGAESGMQPVLEWVQLTTPVSLPTRIDKVEHHPFSDQTFLPHSAAPFLVVVCPARPDGTPDGAAARAFTVPATHGVTFRRGVWHRSLAPLSAPSAFTMSMARTGRGDDTVIVTLDTAVIVTG